LVTRIFTPISSLGLAVISPDYRRCLPNDCEILKESARFHRADTPYNKVLTAPVVERRPIMSYEFILIDNPRSMVRRITLNRPQKRNALNNRLRTEILQAIEEADRDPDVRVSILRGAGGCFSAGYDLGMNNTNGQPYYTAGGSRNWLATWLKVPPVFGIWPSQ